jgi:hypothetical protein
MKLLKLRMIRMLYKPVKDESDEIIKFLETIRSDKGYKACFCLYLQKEEFYTFFIRYDFQKHLSQLKTKMEVCGLNVTYATFGKLRLGESQENLMRCFVRIGAYQKDLPYIDFCEEDEKSYRDSLLDLDIS